MIGFNPTPELKKLLTHHHNKHQSIHIQAKTQNPNHKKTHEILHCLQISSRNNSLRVEITTLLLTNENLKLLLKTKSENKIAHPII